MLRTVLASLVLVLLMLGVGAELTRAAADLVPGTACCACDDADGHEVGSDCCADDFGTCGCAPVSVVATSEPDARPPTATAEPLATRDATNPAPWRCRPAGPPPTPPPIG